MGRFFQAIIALLVAWMILQYLPAWDWPTPPKPDPVDPRPDPDDDKPEPDFDGYDDKVYERILKVKSRNRPKECEKLSDGIGDVIEDIDDGKITDNQAVVDALVKEFKKLPSSWYGQIRSIADDVLQPLTNDGSLSTPARWAKLLKVAQKGVDRAAKESTGVEEESKE